MKTLTVFGLRLEELSNPVRPTEEAYEYLNQHTHVCVFAHRTGEVYTVHVLTLLPGGIGMHESKGSSWEDAVQKWHAQAQETRLGRSIRDRVQAVS